MAISSSNLYQYNVNLILWSQSTLGTLQNNSEVQNLKFMWKMGGNFETGACVSCFTI